MAVQYTIEAEGVVYTHHYTGRQVLQDADTATFTPLVDPVALGSANEDWHFAGKDRNSVWFMSRRIEEADPETFRYFFGGQCHWGVDSSHVFAFYPGSKPRVKIAKSTAAKSFRFLDEPFGAYMRSYALNEHRVYYFGRWVRGADPATFRNIPKDRLNDQSARSDIYRDDRFAYYFGRKLAGLDPDALIVFHYPSLGSRVYALDRERAYRVDPTTRTPGRDVSGTPLTVITPEEVRTLPQYQQVRDYIAQRTDLSDYWFSS